MKTNNEELLKSFSEAVKKNFKEIIKEYSFNQTKIDSRTYEFTSKYCILRIFFYNGHRQNIVITLQPKLLKGKALGLSFLVRLINFTESLGINNIKTKNDVSQTIGIQVQALQKYCKPILGGDFSKWSELEAIALKRSKEAENKMKEKETNWRNSELRKEAEDAFRDKNFQRYIVLFDKLKDNATQSDFKK